MSPEQLCELVGMESSGPGDWTLQLLRLGLSMSLPDLALLCEICHCHLDPHLGRPPCPFRLEC